jgi:hypothetical protein
MVEYNKIFTINDEEHKYCITCTDLLPVNKFFVMPKNKVGYNVRCKSCEIKRRRDKYNLSKPVWITPDDVLKLLGYDVEGDIHQQFCDRYNLPYKQKVD